MSGESSPASRERSRSRRAVLLRKRGLTHAINYFFDRSVGRSRLHALLKQATDVATERGDYIYTLGE